jgi:hypothetical protein
MNELFVVIMKKMSELPNESWGKTTFRNSNNSSPVLVIPLVAGFHKELEVKPVTIRLWAVSRNDLNESIKEIRATLSEECHKQDIASSSHKEIFARMTKEQVSGKALSSMYK